MWTGMEFHIWGASTRKARAPKERLCRGTESKWLADERMDLAGLWYCKSSVRYGGWPVLRILWTKQASLNRIRHSMGSQWSCLRSSVDVSRETILNKNASYNNQWTMHPLVLSIWGHAVQRKGKPAASRRQHSAVRIWRPLAKKFTAIQWHAISNRWFIVTVAVARSIVCEIFSRISLEVEIRHFRPLCSDCRPPEEERPAACNTSLDSTFSGLQFCPRRYESIFIY